MALHFYAARPLDATTRGEIWDHRAETWQLVTLEPAARPLTYGLFYNVWIGEAGTERVTDVIIRQSEMGSEILEALAQHFQQRPFEDVTLDGHNPFQMPLYFGLV